MTKPTSDNGTVVDTAVKDGGLLRTGVVGTLITALCCFTPVLVIAAGAAGLTAWLGYADYVLLPALAFFMGLTGYAVYRRRRAARCCNTDSV